MYSHKKTKYTKKKTFFFTTKDLSWNHYLKLEDFFFPAYKFTFQLGHTLFAEKLQSGNIKSLENKN